MSDAEDEEGGDGATATEAYGFVGWITSAVCYGKQKSTPEFISYVSRPS